MFVDIAKHILTKSRIQRFQILGLKDLIGNLEKFYVLGIVVYGSFEIED
ncbi:hypothetical protein [Leptospira alexanderi]|nr:hypothetical protein [Leptospira alexanderi]